MDIEYLTESELLVKMTKMKEFQHEKFNAQTMDLYQSMLSMTKKRCFRNMFDYHKSTVAELGEDTSFYTMDFADVLWKCQQWREELPSVQMFYAVKANPDPVLLRMLVVLGVNFDCATEGEIRAVMVAGSRPDQIVFANPVITPKGLRYAKKVQVSLMTFDSEIQLLRVCKIYPGARLLIRICPPEVKCEFDFSEKFGCRLDEAFHLLRLAKALGLNIVGVSFHVGSLNRLSGTFAAALLESRKVFDYAESLGFCFSILDIGGGFTGSIGTDDLFRETAQSIRESLSTYFPMESVQVIGEPGCYVVNSAATVTTTIIGKRTRRDQTGTTSALKRLYFLNNSIYHSFPLVNEPYGITAEPLLNQKVLLQRPCYKSTLFGQTLCSLDVIQKDIVLQDMNVGESIVWKNTGAYNLTLVTTFCGFEKPAVRYVFQRNKELKSDWIINLEQIIKHLSNFVHVIDEEE